MSAQKLKHVLIVMELEEVAAEARARPEVPSATHATEATDQPDKRVTVLEVKSAESVDTASAETIKVMALLPPQIVVESPEHGMVHAVESKLREAPLVSKSPQ